jgi:hypothetical protein
VELRVVDGTARDRDGTKRGPDGSDVTMNAGFDGLIIVPGYGHVYIGVGRVVVTVDASGNVTEVSVGARDPDHSGVCPLLR